jgi:hypothetical protein
VNEAFPTVIAALAGTISLIVAVTAGVLPERVDLLTFPPTVAGWGGLLMIAAAGLRRGATRESIADAAMRGQLYGLLAGVLLFVAAAAGILGS